VTLIGDRPDTGEVVMLGEIIQHCYDQGQDSGPNLERLP